jgi:hypothetical protein
MYASKVLNLDVVLDRVMDSKVDPRRLVQGSAVLYVYNAYGVFPDPGFAGKEFRSLAR